MNITMMVTNDNSFATIILFISLINNCAKWTLTWSRWLWRKLLVGQDQEGKLLRWEWGLRTMQTAKLWGMLRDLLEKVISLLFLSQKGKQEGCVDGFFFFSYGSNLDIWLSFSIYEHFVKMDTLLWQILFGMLWQILFRINAMWLV